MPENLEIIYRDHYLAVVNKPGGLLSVPGRGPHKQDCVVSRVRDIIPNLPEQPAVHRLDLHTSGLMLLARNQDVHSSLSRQFEERTVKKHYIGVVEGYPEQQSGTITLSFRLDPANRPRQVYDPVNGKEGTTRWRLLAQTGNTARIEFSPITGRTHQIRLHAAHPKGLGCPIVGDFLYGSGQDGDKMLLHASFLEFIHPISGIVVTCTSAPPF